jgi:hypothetical protein
VAVLEAGLLMVHQVALAAEAGRGTPVQLASEALAQQGKVTLEAVRHRALHITNPAAAVALVLLALTHLLQLWGLVVTG